MSKKDSKVLEENEILKTQIDASIGVARSLVQSWLPSPKAGEKLDDTEEDEKTFSRYSTGRPDRLGLGAKFLSHKEAIQHQTPTISKNELKLRNKILNQNRRADTNADDNTTSAKRKHQEVSDDDDDEEESRTRSVKTAPKAKQESTTPEPSNYSNSSGSTNKKIGAQGDFLSMYLSEKAGKKKKKKKNKKTGQNSGDAAES
ncbi:hypothetical protein BDB00DRAFT_102549 [Zychaea mexicana]|uniref:uncharacterized protein n=1 Tax=Zychaea mexicana TaxID=64656 RepID=UPI0022FE08A5|nr:uncharacterized protein BDB00DRAFT_102549 [Zychaea mexicana]KAI9496670.1 hypothetical protein BDB00DRAFT_102549 [Zychaea mexicana]